MENKSHHQPRYPSDITYLLTDLSISNNDWRKRLDRSCSQSPKRSNFWRRHPVYPIGRTPRKERTNRQDRATDGVLHTYYPYTLSISLSIIGIQERDMETRPSYPSPSPPLPISISSSTHLHLLLYPSPSSLTDTHTISTVHCYKFNLPRQTCLCYIAKHGPGSVKEHRFTKTMWLIILYRGIVNIDFPPKKFKKGNL